MGFDAWRALWKLDIETLKENLGREHRKVSFGNLESGMCIEKGVGSCESGSKGQMKIGCP